MSMWGSDNVLRRTLRDAPATTSVGRTRQRGRCGAYTSAPAAPGRLDQSVARPVIYATDASHLQVKNRTVLRPRCGTGMVHATIRRPPRRRRRPMPEEATSDAMLLTIPQAARQARVSENTIRAWIATGRLRSVRIDRRRRIHPA